MKDPPVVPTRNDNKIRLSIELFFTCIHDFVSAGVYRPINLAMWAFHEATKHDNVRENDQ